jgi:hypothetical protein
MIPRRFIIALVVLALSLAAGESAHAQDSGNNGDGGSVASGNSAENGGTAGDGNGNGDGTGEAIQGEQGGAENPEPINNADTAANAVLDHDAALEAVEQGDAVPLETVYERVKQDTAAEILDAELLVISGLLVYELKLFDPGTQTVRRRYFYAASGDRIVPR